MEQNSRVHQSFVNARVGIVFVVINTLLQFFVRKTFLVYLGTEILGLNTSAQNLLQFLNLAELGIGAAIGFSLYKPLYDGDRDKINEIMALQGHLYRYIAYVVIAGALLLSAFFPLIFAKMELPLWYAYASFGVLLFSALLSYFVNYTQVLLSADQKEYKVIYGFRFWLILRLVAQYFAVRYLPNPYIWWLILEVLFTVIASVMLRRTVYREYPFLNMAPYKGRARELRRKYPEIVVKIKQLFFHKISLYILQQTSPLIIYAFLNLSIVAIYGNYTYIVIGMSLAYNAMFQGMNASIGNLIAQGDKPHILRIFSETFSLRFWIAFLLAWELYIIGQPFISQWVGSVYLLPDSTLLILSLTLFLNYSGNAVEAFVQGYGMYKDIWSPIVEAVLNLGLSIVGGALWGLNGILLGVLVSRVFQLFFWKPIFLYHWGFKIPVIRYFGLYGLHALAALAALALYYIFLPHPFLSFPPGWIPLIWQSLAAFAIIVALSLATMLIFTPGMKLLGRRVVKKFG